MTSAAVMPNEQTRDLSRSDVDRLPGPVLLEFGTRWCGWCRAAQPLVRAALAAHPEVRHVWVEDGPGRPLGRSFGVKLWPTLVLLQDGREVVRIVRPANGAALDAAFERLVAASPTEPPAKPAPGQAGTDLPDADSVAGEEDPGAGLDAPAAPPAPAGAAQRA